MRWPIWGAVGTVVIHLGVGAGILLIPKDGVKKSSLIAVVDRKKKKDEKKEEDKQAKADEPPPPPKPIEAPRKKAAPKPQVENTPPPPTNAPTPLAAAHPQLAALPDLGISMAGGPGGIGIAVPVGGGGDPGTAAAPRTEASAVKPKAAEGCTEPEVKPKSVPLATGGIIAAAQSASIYGRLKLEHQIDESGKVSSARVLTGLGGGIDEAALAAAKQVKVSPITRCGKPVAGRMTWATTLREPD
jgi:protein TonB